MSRLVALDFNEFYPLSSSPGHSTQHRRNTERELTWSVQQVQLAKLYEATEGVPCGGPMTPLDPELQAELQRQFILRAAAKQMERDPRCTEFEVSVSEVSPHCTEFILSPRKASTPDSKLVLSADILKHLPASAFEDYWSLEADAIETIAALRDVDVTQARKFLDEARRSGRVRSGKSLWIKSDEMDLKLTAETWINWSGLFESLKRPRRGPKPGTVKSLDADYQALFPTVKRLLDEGKARSATAAALQLAVAGKVPGNGTPYSRARGLATAYLKHARVTR